MTTMNVEKRILMDEKMDRLIKLNAQENLHLQDESDGKRCIGFVDLKGEYLVDQEVRKFHEFIECDIFAPTYKINSEAFNVTLVDVNGEIDHGLLVNLTFEIEGLNEEDGMSIEDDDLDLMGLEDLFEENENLYTNTRLIVAKHDDTYESIAERFSVDVDELRKANHDVQIKPKLCILIPKS